LQVVPVIDDLPFKVFPVVEAGAAEVVVVDAEPERANEPELRADGDAGAADAARVVRDLRLVQHDVQLCFVFGMRFGH